MAPPVPASNMSSPTEVLDRKLHPQEVAHADLSQRNGQDVMDGHT